MNLDTQDVTGWLGCVQAGITDPSELAAILMHNPHCKFQRDKREDYLEVTVAKLMRTIDTD